MKLPTSLGGLCIRKATSQLEVSFDTKTRETRAHAERMERNLTGEREYPAERRDHGENESWDGTHNVKHDDRDEAMTEPLKRDFVNASKGHGFFYLHQLHPENSRDHRCTQALDESEHD